mmetsp:Transcript_97352/g.172364  ORF Transcript_97352/g.172364 Transcript_97352/m.172364 type:complete len:565 (+) Transcript_97352:54-1748(+)
MPIRRDALADPWRGVNLGGWLLLEPGPSHPLFSEHLLQETQEEARCEWDFMKNLQKTIGKKRAAEVIRNHRETHTTKSDFERIRECGLNAVRLPIGYWCVLGPSESEPYDGPALEYVDRAVEWADACGLQIVLDLHGCPGGESGEAPCGRRQRPHGTWHWRHWRMGQTLQAIDALVQRYQKHRCVTGVAVCNEPSNSVPLSRLCRYYDKAVHRIRAGGMSASRVTVLLPLFQRDEEEVTSFFHKLTKGRHRNICFDVHCYHCFEDEFQGKTLAGHMRAIEANAAMLRKYPMVVGEWSLALGAATWTTCGEMAENEVYRLLGCGQVKAFREASHGSFFWNWRERDDVEWNFQKAFEQGLLSGPALQLPRWREVGKDPLEDKLNPSPSGPNISWGDAVHLRTFYGRYVDVEATTVQARWADKGLWQEFSFEPVSPSGRILQRSPRQGDVIRIIARSGQVLTMGDDGVMKATRRRPGEQSEFILHIKGATTLSHGVSVYFECKSTSLVVNADPDKDGLFSEFEDLGWWQEFGVEKALHSKFTPKKKRELSAGKPSADSPGRAVRQRR